MYIALHHLWMHLPSHLPVTALSVRLALCHVAGTSPAAVHCPFLTSPLPVYKHRESSNEGRRGREGGGE